MIIRGISYICSAWFLDIIILTCSDFEDVIVVFHKVSSWAVTVYMNDLPYASCVNNTLILFAGDTMLFHCIKSKFDVDQLQRDTDMLWWNRESCGFFPLTSQSASIYKLDQVHIMLHIFCYVIMYVCTL